MTNEPGGSRHRPLGVWIVSAIYALWACWSLNLALGAHPASSLPRIEQVLLLAIVLLVFSAAVSLFLLRRIAVSMFSVALGLSVATTAIQVMKGIEGAGRGAMFGWILLVAVIVYARRLAKSGVLS
jgi:hypothetical protein